MGWGLCPLLTSGAVEALQSHGSRALQERYLPKLISGEWTGTMNLTEPQAGSDVGALRARAVPEGDHWRITGQKIFITYGDHDFTDNIIHLVLARTPARPAGTKGISLFWCPKCWSRTMVRSARANDVRTVSLEHKLGIHASPTAVLSFGDNGGAIGWMIGQEIRGMEYMFTMMNSARLNVGLQGIAISERAYQQARDYAKTRIQGKPMTARGSGEHPIIDHPDVKRMLLAIKTRTEAARGLAYFRRGLDRSRPPHRRCRGACGGAGPGRSADPAGQGVVDRSWRREHLPRRADSWRHGFSSKRRRCAALSRRPHRADL